MHKIFEDAKIAFALVFVFTIMGFIFGIIFTLIVADIFPEFFNLFLTHYVDEITGGCNDLVDFSTHC